MNKKHILVALISLCTIFNELHAQKWIVKDSILVFPQGFSSWLKRNNGGIDSAAPGNGNSSGAPGNIGTNQGVDVFDFNKDGLPDLTFQLFPSNNVTREYLKAIFIQNSIGKYILDTNSDRIYSPEMIYDNWPDRVFINNGKGFDTLSLDIDNLQGMSAYTSDIDKDGTDEIVLTAKESNNSINVYKYNKTTKKFFKIEADLTSVWNTTFNRNKTRYPIFNVANVNNQNEFGVILYNNIPSGDFVYDYNNFTYAIYNFSNKKITSYSLNRDSILFSKKYSKEDSDDYYKFSLHEIVSIYKMDIDKNGEEELVAGGFYQNNNINKQQRFAYGWKVLGLNGKDLTTQFFKDSGIDRGVDLIAHGLDIDENVEGIEMIPGTWGIDLKYYIDGSPNL